MTRKPPILSNDLLSRALDGVSVGVAVTNWVYVDGVRLDELCIEERDGVI